MNRLGIGLFVFFFFLTPTISLATYISPIGDGSVLFRGSQPKDYNQLRQRGIRTVLSLRQSNIGKERPKAQRAGVQFYNIPIRDRSTPSFSQVREFLSFVTNTENQPILVHCQGGHGRTNIMIAAYRIAVEGWTVEAALSEGRRFGLTRRSQIDFVRGIGSQLIALRPQFERSIASVPSEPARDSITTISQITSTPSSGDPNALLRVVVRDENNKGIGGAQVKIRNSKTEQGNSLSPTDGNGYAERNSERNTYIVEVSASGYVSQTQRVDLNGLTTLGFNLVSRENEGRDQPANPNALLRIFVKDENSRAVSGARGQMKRYSTGEDRPMGNTDGKGYVENNALRNDYIIEISKEGYRTETRDIYLDKMMTITVVLKRDQASPTGSRTPASADLPLDVSSRGDL